MFPLLQLPYLCIQAIFNQSSPRDLIHFSLASKKSYRLLKCMRVRVNRLTLRERQGMIIFDDFLEAWYVNEDKYKEKATITVNMNGAEVKTFVNDTDSYSYTDQPIFEFWKYAARYLTDIFVCYFNNFGFNIDRMENMNNVLDFGVTKCHRLRLEGERAVKDEEMLNIIEKFTLKHLALGVNLSDTFYCDPDLFKTDNMCLANNAAKWITRDVLLRLQRIQSITLVTAGKNSLTADDFIAFVTKWYHSENRQFKQLLLCAEWELPFHLLTQFNSREYDPKERGPVFRCLNENFNCVGGTDILRSDGLLATIYQIDLCVLFHVWHDRFPDIKEE